jgi:maltooligosyltrehalose trehalohydrolase
MRIPEFGAFCVPGGARFRVLAPAATKLSLVLHGGSASGEHTMRRADSDGVWELDISGVRVGQHYSYRVDDGRGLPDPASRFQPLGVHGPSELIDPADYQWTDGSWSGVAPERLVLYELHTGTFSATGTFAGIREKLPYLRDLGITAIEIMPVADFAGSRNWGYDGVALYAPSRAYGRPEDLRALVDCAHRLGLAVILDVVYNHLGPEGAYLPVFNPQFLLPQRPTPWGGAVNLDGPGSAGVRRLIIDNAVHWIREYHLDGLRLDATHTLLDEGTVPFLREFSKVVRRASPRAIVLHAEDCRNLNEIVRDDTDRGWEFDALWADDFHHSVRSMVAGDRHGYYADYNGTVGELVKTLQHGWLFAGEHSKHMQKSRGTDPSAVPMLRFIVCLQNHDQIGNRPFGERLHHQVDEATWRAASVLLLMAPMTPLLFMGQEWSAATPFQFFTDLEPGLGRLVTDGRRHEFRDFPDFAAAEARIRIPDPQADATFEASRLRWDEHDRDGHARTLALYRELLALRAREAALHASRALFQEAAALDEDTVFLRRVSEDACFHVVVRLRGAGTVDMPSDGFAIDLRRDAVLTTEETRFVSDPHSIALSMVSGSCRIGFSRPGAIVMKTAPARGTS